MGEKNNTNSKIPVGICREHGVIAGNAVNFNFPNPATCGLCGAELERAALAKSDEINEATHANTNTEHGDTNE